MLSDSELSVVVQGGISKYTLKSLKRIREFLPNSEIILSTWKDTDISFLSGYYDLVVFSDMPEAFDYGNGSLNNLNRQLISTQKGIELSKRKYVLKLRSDLVLKNNKILNISDTYKRNNDLLLFKKRIIVGNIFSLKFTTNGKEKNFMPFQISDWFFLGLKEDIKKLFDIPIAKEPDNTYYFKKHTYDKNKYCHFKNLTWRYTAEQYIQYMCVSKYFSISFKHMMDYNKKNIEFSEKYVVNNFLILDKKKTGIEILKEPYKSYNYLMDGVVRNSMYDDYIWQSDYKKYIDPEFKISKYVKIKHKLKLEKCFIKFIENVDKLKISINNFFRIFFDPAKYFFKALKGLFKILFRFFVLLFEKDK